MAGSVNKVILIGNLGAEPDVRTMPSGDEIVNLSLATSESWKDKQTGERREKTEWHRVVIFNKGLVTVAKNYLHKGSKVYLEGQVETRSWEQNGEKKYTTEIVLRPFRGELTMLDTKGQGQGQGGGYQDNSQQGSYGAASAPAQQAAQPQQAAAAPAPMDNMEDEIPF